MTSTHPHPHACYTYLPTRLYLWLHSVPSSLSLHLVKVHPFSLIPGHQFHKSPPLPYQFLFFSEAVPSPHINFWVFFLRPRTPWNSCFLMLHIAHPGLTPGLYFTAECTERGLLAQDTKFFSVSCSLDACCVALPSKCPSNLFLLQSRLAEPVGQF